MPTALCAGFASVPELIVPARAVESRMHVAYCNHAGVEDGMSFPGQSRLAGPDGAIIAAAGAGDALIVGDIGAAGCRAQIGGAASADCALVVRKAQRRRRPMRGCNARES